MAERGQWRCGGLYSDYYSADGLTRLATITKSKAGWTAYDLLAQRIPHPEIASDRDRYALHAVVEMHFAPEGRAVVSAEQAHSAATIDENWGDPDFTSAPSTAEYIRRIRGGGRAV